VCEEYRNIKIFINLEGIIYTITIITISITIKTTILYINVRDKSDLWGVIHTLRVLLILLFVEN